MKLNQNTLSMSSPPPKESSQTNMTTSPHFITYLSSLGMGRSNKESGGERELSSSTDSHATP